MTRMLNCPCALAMFLACVVSLRLKRRRYYYTSLTKRLTMKRQDLSEFENHGEITDAEWTEDGKVGGALVFDGVSSFD